MEAHIRVAETRSITPIVRVDGNESALISHALDKGAQGILCPHISSAEAASSLVRASRFAPDGERGVCRYVRAADYTHMKPQDYFARANEATIVVAMIEGKQGISQLDEIIPVPRINVVFIGPYDLSQSLGVTGQVNNPIVVNEMRELVSRLRANNLSVGTFVDNMEAATMWQDCGVQFIAYSVDVGIMFTAMSQISQGLKSNR